jgi:hypothetical protein
MLRSCSYSHILRILPSSSAAATWRCERAAGVLSARLDFRASGGTHRRRAVSPATASTRLSAPKAARCAYLYGAKRGVAGGLISDSRWVRGLCSGKHTWLRNNPRHHVYSGIIDLLIYCNIIQVLYVGLRS